MSKPAPRGIQPRTVRGWVVVNGGGHPWVHTACLLRRHAIAAYYESGTGNYADDRKAGLALVVRCSITTEVKP